MKKFLSVIMFVLIFLPILNYSPTTSYACSCVEPGPVKEELERSSAVFSGKVIEMVDKNKTRLIQSSTEPIAVRLEVIEVWKGQSQTEIIVYTERDSASCGFNFDMDKEYLVYAKEIDGELRVSLCSRTALLFNATKDIQELGEGEKPMKEILTDSNVNSKAAVNPYRIYLIAAFLGLLVVVTVFLARRIKKK